MFKKNSWIVALILALAVTALFTGCIEALEPTIEPTYTEVELGDFNVWGGQVYQKGWATDGLVFKGAGDAITVAAAKGYKSEDLRKATRLVLEAAPGKPGGNLDICWGFEDGSGKEWNLNGAKSTKSGDTITIDLTNMVKYDQWVDASVTGRKIIIQAGGDGDPASWIKKAKLMIPDIQPPPPPPPFPGKGAYVVPNTVDTYNTSFYVDLNNANESPASGGKAAGTSLIEKDKITIGFTAANQNFYVPFTAEQAAFVTAALQQGYSISVTVDGTYSGSTNYRWTLMKDSGSDWASFAFKDQGAGLSVSTKHAMGAKNQNDTPQAFMFQARDNASGVSSKLELRSVLVEVSGTGTATPGAVSTLAFTIDWGIGTTANPVTAPYAGARAPTTVSAGLATYSGKLTWTPEPPNGKFAPLTQYTANIEVTASLGSYLGGTATATVNTVSAAFLPGSPTSAKVFYSFPKYTEENTDPAERPEYAGSSISINVVSELGVSTPQPGKLVSARNGNIGYKEGNTGFIFSSKGGGGWQEEYPYFQANVGERLAKSRIRFKYKGIDGDIGWKTVGIAILDSVPTPNDLDVNITAKGDVKNKTGSTVGKVVWNEYYDNNGQAEKVFTATLTDALTAGNKYFVITVHAPKKAFEVYDIEFLPTPPEVLAVKVGATSQNVKPVGAKAEVELLDGSVGYKYKTTGSYSRSSYVYFPVDLGATKTIASFSSVKFTISGSDTYKNVGVIISGSAFGDYIITQEQEAALATGGDWGTASGLGGATVQNKQYNIATGTPAAGAGVIVNASATGKDVFIGFYVHHGDGSTYQIENIELVE